MKKKLIIKGEEVELTADETIEKFTKMIYKIVRKMNREDISEELIQCGRIGVWKGFKVYDISKGHEFITIAHILAEREIFGYFNYLKHKGRDKVNLSLDSDNDTENLENDCKGSNIIPDKARYFENSDIHMDFQIIKNYIENTQSKKMKEYISYLEKGYTESEIAKILGITRQAVNNRKTILFKNIREAFKEDFKEYMC